MDEKKKTGASSSSVFRSKSTRGILLVSVVAVALAVVVNLLVSQLPVSYTHFDTTNIQLYSISDYTRQVVSNLEDDIDLYLVAQYGSEDTIVQELLENYDGLSDRIHSEQVDPVLHPEFVEQFTSSLEANSVIVSSGDRFQVIRFSEMYVDTYQYDYGAPYVDGSYFTGEQEITSAITFVTSDDLPKMYLLTGHGEEELPSYIREAVERENIETEELNLGSQGAVPEDADLLLLYAPERDLLDGEVEPLLSYLQGGGRMMCIIGPLAQATPNLDEVIGYYGVERLEGTVMERNTNYYVDQYPSYVLGAIASHDITQPLVNRGYYALMPMSQGLVPQEDVRDTIVSSPLVYTTDSALSVVASGEEESSLTATAMGPFTLGLAVEESLDDADTRLVVFTSSYLIQEDVNQLSSGTNYDLFLNSLSWLYDYEDGIAIRSKDLMMEYLTVQSSTAVTLGVVMAVLVPVAILAAGGVVLYRRRRR